MTELQPIALSVTGAANRRAAVPRIDPDQKTRRIHVAERPNPRLNRVVPKIPRGLASVQKGQGIAKPDAALVAAVCDQAASLNLVLCLGKATCPLSM
jgi:hypothetical protein